MTPGRAVGRLVLPLYGFFWNFKVHTRLCAAIDETLTYTTVRAPRGLAILAPALTVVADLLPFALEERAAGFYLEVASSAVWFLYMHECDTARRAMAESRALEIERGRSSPGP